MATIARDATSSGSTAGTSLTISHTVAGTNRMLFVMPLEDASGLTATRITGITYNGVAMTKLAETYRTFSSGFVQTMWGLVAPDTGTHDIVITLSASDTISSQNASYTGCAQSLPTGNALKTFSSNSADKCLFNPVTIADDSWAIARCIGIDAATQDDTNFVGFGFTNNTGGDSNGGLGTAGTETVQADQGAGVRWGGCTCAVFAPAATTETTLNLSENLSNSIIERFSRIWTAPRSWSEIVGLQSEGVTRTWSLSRGLPIDIVTITESVNSLKGRIIEILETMGIVDTVSRTVSWVRNFNESVTIREILNRITEIVITELVAISDSVTRAWSLARSYLDSVSIIEYLRTPLNWLKRTVPTTIWTKRTKP